MPLKFLSLLLVVVIACSCASIGRRRLPPGARRVPVSKPSTGAKTEASNALIEEGRLYLDQMDYERAFDTFQAAVNVDPTNGSGFYYLAWVKYSTGEYEMIPRFLDKAEALLGNDRAWRERLDFLKEQTRQ